MRRTDIEFKAEVLRRAEQYRAERRKRTKRTLLVCLPLLLCCGALLAVFSMGYGGSTKGVAYDSAMSVECMDAPAAPAPESVEEESASQADSPMEPAEGKKDQSSDAKVLSITVTTHSESAELVRLFTSESEMQAILDAINRFPNDPQTVIGGDEVGDSEGMAYVIAVITETEDREYVLFHDALLIDGIWYVNAGCYQNLEELILQESD